MTSNIEPKWKTYLKSAVLGAPALIVWAVGSVFVFPKLKQVWADTGFALPFAQTALVLSDFCMDHGLLLFAVIIISLVFLEWRASIWPRYRRGFFSAAVFCINTAVLVLMSSIVISLLIVIPPLLSQQ